MNGTTSGSSRRLTLPDGPKPPNHPLSPSHPSHPRLPRSISTSTVHTVPAIRPVSIIASSSSTSNATEQQSAGSRASHLTHLKNRHHRSGSTPRKLADGDLLGRRPSAASDQDGSALATQNEVSQATLESALAGFTPEEMAVINMRFDMMDDEEIKEILDTLAPSSQTSASTRNGEDHEDDEPSSTSPETPKPKKTIHMSRRKEAMEDSSSDTPLFPPSPPPFQARTDEGSENRHDHPMRVLSRAIRQLQATVDHLVLENENLQEQLEPSVSALNSQQADRAEQASLNENMAEALSTSLNTPSPLQLHPTQSHPVPPVPKPVSPIPTTHSVPIIPRKKSPAISLPPDNKSGLPSKSTGSWTSGLWVWNSKKPRTKTRRGSIDSITSNLSGRKVDSQTTSLHVPEEVILDEPDPEEWRKGDGGSSPAFRAIVNATRIITPDPSSILTSPTIPSNSLVAYLAHSLVSNARDDGLTTRAPPNIRNTSSRSRSRATSVVSQKSQITPTDLTGKDASKALHGLESDSSSAGQKPQSTSMETAYNYTRSLINSVSTATLRPSKSSSGPADGTRHMVGEIRTAPTKSLGLEQDPSFMNQGRSGSSATSPTEERPLPSVELSSIVPDEARPPTVLLSRQNLGSFFQSSKTDRAKIPTASRFNGALPPLTDRYGFIYDIQHAKLLKDASAAGAAAPASLNGTITIHTEKPKPHQIHRSRSPTSDALRQLSTTRSLRSPSLHSDPVFSETSTVSSIRSISPTPSKVSPSPRKSSPIPPDESTPEKKKRHRASSTLLPLNPSPAKASTAKDHFTVSVRGSSSLGVTSEPSASSLTTVPSAANLTASSNSSASRSTISSLLDQLTEIHDQQQKERQSEWDTFLKKRSKLTSGNVSGIEGIGLLGAGQLGKGSMPHEEWKIFARLVRRGIPLSYRSDIWAECSGAKDMLVPGEYKSILKTHSNQTNPFLLEIEKDISRTFPSNVFFGGDGPGVEKLKRVLVAYSWHDPIVGYCQGMNMLAATLLLTYTEEEQAFWTLVAVVEKLLPASFFSPDLLASRADQAVLGDLVAQYAPKMHKHLVEMGIDLASITFGWFLSLFTDCLPVETLFRVWDVFFLEGHDVLFLVALAILKMNENEILASETIPDLFATISSVTSRLWAADKLIALQHSYKPIIKHSDIEAKFDVHIAALQAPPSTEI